MKLLTNTTNTRIHYFPISGERVVTALTRKGDYCARYIDKEAYGNGRGYGYSRLAAIANLNEVNKSEDCA